MASTLPRQRILVTVYGQHLRPRTPFAFPRPDLELAVAPDLTLALLAWWHDSSFILSVPNAYRHTRATGDRGFCAYAAIRSRIFRSTWHTRDSEIPNSSPMLLNVLPFAR